MLKNPAKNLHQNLIQFQFVMPVIITDFLMFTASNDQQVMNLQICYLANLNKSLADELNQPTSFPTVRSRKNPKTQ